jgi:HAE1 family hydrophobic/amphiphilic exporter-1
VTADAGNTLSIAGFGAQQVVNSGTIFVRLVPIDDREDAQSELIRRAREIVATYPRDLTTSVQPVAAFSGGGMRSSAIQYVLSGSELRRPHSSKLLRPRANLNSSTLTYAAAGKPSCRRDDRQRGDRRERGRILETLNFATQQISPPSTRSASARCEPVRRASPPTWKPAPHAARQGGDGACQRVRLRTGTAPATIDRLNRERQVTLLANVPPGGSQSEGLDAIEAATAARHGAGYAASLTGNARAEAVATASRSRCCRSSSCTWCWRRSSSRGSTR